MRAFGITADVEKARKHFMCYHAHVHCGVYLHSETRHLFLRRHVHKEYQALRGRQNSCLKRQYLIFAIFDTDLSQVPTSLHQVSKRLSTERAVNYSRSFDLITRRRIGHYYRVCYYGASVFALHPYTTWRLQNCHSAHTTEQRTAFHASANCMVVRTSE